MCARRYATTFDQGQLDELIKQGLTFAGERGRNIGRKPLYIYGCRHYRRTLQLVRFKSQEIKDRDEILVQLFIRNYGVKPHEVRDALGTEYRKTREKLNAPLRSTFVDKDGPIPPGRKSQLRHQIGTLDERLNNAGFVIQAEFLISFTRTARNFSNRALKETPINNVPAAVQELFNSLMPLFGGMLTKDDENESGIEKIIRSSSENEYEIAKTIFQQIRAMLSPRSITGENNSPEQIAYRAIYDSIFRREFAAFLLVQCLIIASHQSDP